MHAYVVILSLLPCDSAKKFFLHRNCFLLEYCRYTQEEIKWKKNVGGMQKETGVLLSLFPRCQTFGFTEEEEKKKKYASDS